MTFLWAAPVKNDIEKLPLVHPLPQRRGNLRRRIGDVNAYAARWPQGAPRGPLFPKEPCDENAPASHSGTREAGQRAPPLWKRQNGLRP